MLSRLLFSCTALLCFYMAAIRGQSSPGVRIPLTRFTCTGRASGYYADVETGCQVYHMCDGLGRQFSYTCPNTTLFQQRMLICDHWYMVNCSMSERDYSANLLIGQRDKPFVSEEEMRQRTPRPDILSVPPNNNYFDGLKEAESKYPVHPSNSIVGVADSISNSNNNDLDSGKNQYRPPSSWSTGTGVRPQKPEEESLTVAASQNPGPTIQTTQVTEPPKVKTTESSEEFELNIRMKPTDSVVQFINRFDPNSPDTQTAMTTDEIININRQLPTGPDASEEERTPRKQNFSPTFNTLTNDDKKTTPSRFDTVNLKPSQVNTEERINRELLPPKQETSSIAATTVGPAVYYEWKWAVPAFNLEPPKIRNDTNTSSSGPVKEVTSPFRNVTRPRPKEVDLKTSNTEYNTSSYFVPDYVFPLDKPHPGYQGDDARSSFQVNLAKSGERNFGENPNCPHCHPAYLKPGTCEPCIVKR